MNININDRIAKQVLKWYATQPDRLYPYRQPDEIDAIMISDYRIKDQLEKAMTNNESINIIHTWFINFKARLVSFMLQDNGSGEKYILLHIHPYSRTIQLNEDEKIWTFWGD